MQFFKKVIGEITSLPAIEQERPEALLIEESVKASRAYMV